MRRRILHNPHVLFLGRVSAGCVLAAVIIGTLAFVSRAWIRASAEPWVANVFLSAGTAREEWAVSDQVHRGLQLTGGPTEKSRGCSEDFAQGFSTLIGCEATTVEHAQSFAIPELPRIDAVLHRQGWRQIPDTPDAVAAQNVLAIAGEVSLYYQEAVNYSMQCNLAIGANAVLGGHYQTSYRISCLRMLSWL